MLPAPWRVRRLPEPRRLVPSARSLGYGLAAAVLGAALYAGARYTPAFAIRTIDVRGVRGAEAAQVRRALEPVVGTSLVSLHGDDVTAVVAALPAVAGVRYDRAFPHTLRVVVVPERPVAIVRQGLLAWLVSGEGRVIRNVPRDRAGALPRIWLPRTVDISPGARLRRSEGGLLAAALASARANRFPYPIASASAHGGRVAFVLRSGVQLELGEAAGEPLKLAIARRALPLLPAAATYLDVSVPQRPVSGGTLNSQVEVNSCCASGSLSAR